MEPVWYFYTLAGFSLYKLMYSLWIHDAIPSTNFVKPMEPLFVVSFTILAFLVIFIGLVFLLYYFLLTLDLPFVTSTSILSATPYVWGGLMMLAVMVTEIDPDD